MISKRIKFLLFFFFVLSSLLKAQETIITGRVTEVGVNSGIPFVNIYFKGTVIGTVTDFDGNYSIKTLTPKDSIYVSLIGYKSKAKPVKKGLTQIINFQLSPQVLNLNIVEVHPGINPALRIIKNAQGNKEKYNRNNLVSVQYTSYTKQEADVDNVTPKMRKWRLFKGFTSLWDNLDSLAGEESKANLPVMMSEVIADVYSYKLAEKRHEEVNAVKIKFVGMKDGSAVSQLTGTDFQSYNFCDNNIIIQNKEILNPIAENAMLFYNYYLIDSVTIDSTKCYRIDCRPKNEKDLAFTGSLWITDETFAIKQLDLEITPDVNFNWLDRARIQQVLIPTEAGVWVPSQTRTMVDFSTLTDKFVSLVFRTYNANKNFVVNKPKEKDFYETRIQYAEDALIKDTVWWRTNRQEKLTPLESKSYDMIDTVRSIPLIKNGVNILYFLFSGYKDVGPVDLGHYMQLYSYNQYEGTKLKLGFRTNAKFSKDWIIRGYGAYGFKDKGFKYNLQLERILTRFPWSKAGIQYREDIDQAGTNFNFSQSINLGQNPNNLYNFSSNIGNISKLLKVQEARIWYERDFNFGMSTKITFQNIRTSPLFQVTLDDNQFNIFSLRKYSITEILVDGRFSAKEHYVQNGNERISFGNKKSAVIGFNYTAGLKNVLDGDFTYHKASISYSNRFRMATLGYSRVFIKAGKVFSKIPYTLLEIPRGNETYFYASNTFNQMNLFEFVSDQYVQAFWQHHFNGLFFNRLPLIKKMNLREVVGLNMVYGTLSLKNKIFNANNNFTVMDDVPYFEADLGIENLFNLIRIDFLYRLTYNDDFYLKDYENANPGNKISVWGIKIGLQFSF
ncbi:MAG: carboxypeptidase-like regulatory domain-containing protein [Bacteroidetes bacterium]|nr:carboxypeptidase-like regulatory domain-containing protein [Bacteroidota bacterium]